MTNPDDTLISLQKGYHLLECHHLLVDGQLMEEMLDS